MADAPDLGSGGVTLGSSSLLSRTKEDYYDKDVNKGFTYSLNYSNVRHVSRYYVL